MLKFLEENDATNGYQHEFTKGRSCLTNLLETLEAWTRLLDEGFGFDVIYLDFRKAFDAFSHSKLMDRLKYLRVEERT